MSIIDQILNLEKIALEATQGEWFHLYENYENWYTAQREVIKAESGEIILGGWFGDAILPEDKDWDYIAAANPAIIIKMIQILKNNGLLEKTFSSVNMTSERSKEISIAMAEALKNTDYSKETLHES